MSDTHLANDAAARTGTGELKDQSAPPTPTSTPKELGSETEPTPVSPAKAEGETSFINKDAAGEDKGDKTPAAAPAEYEPFTLPDGFEANEEVMAEATGVFKELGLTQAASQKLVDLYAKQAQAAAQAPVEYWKQMQKDWQAEIKADKELGGKIPAVRATISKAIDQLGDLAVPFREAMDLTGAGNNPAFVRAFYKFSQLLTEGAHVSGGGPTKEGQKAPGSAPISAARALYPNLP